MEFHSLGGTSILCNGAECTGLSAHKQKVVLLFYLAVEAPVARSSLYPLFWPDREEEKARRSLSQLLYALRQELGEEHRAANRGCNGGDNAHQRWLTLVGVEFRKLALTGAHWRW